MTRSPSTTSRAGSVMLSPAAPSSLSMVTTSSSATFSCLPPQRTIAYTRELSFVALSLRALARRWSTRRLAFTSGPAQRATPDRQGYQTAAHPRTRTEAASRSALRHQWNIGVAMATSMEHRFRSACVGLRHGAAGLGLRPGLNDVVATTTCTRRHGCHNDVVGRALAECQAAPSLACGGSGGAAGGAAGASETAGASGAGGAAAGEAVAGAAAADEAVAEAAVAGEAVAAAGRRRRRRPLPERGGG